jgi:hypothetical protein
MLRRPILAAAHLVLLAHLSPIICAQESQLRSGFVPKRSPPSEISGLLTNRLSPKELEQWKIIERLVFAEDSGGQPLHPTLRWLWEWIDTSGHAIYIEVIRMNRTSTCTAGNFSIEHFDPRGSRQIAVIKLNLPNIDQAYVGPNAARANGFVPFADLNKEERYAEVLGHEMAHAVHILNSLELTKKVVEYVEKTNEILLSRHVRRITGMIMPDLKTRLSKRDALLKELEARAEKTESIVWRELVVSKPIRDRMPASVIR